MKRVTVRKYEEYKPDGTYITKTEFSEEISSNGLFDTAIAFIIFFALFIGSVSVFRLMFVPSPPQSEFNSPSLDAAL